VKPHEKNDRVVLKPEKPPTKRKRHQRTFGERLGELADQKDRELAQRRSN